MSVTAGAGSLVFSPTADERISFQLRQEGEQRRCRGDARLGEGRIAVKEKVLCVDDESSALEGYQRILHRQFEVSTAVSGAQGLAILERRGPFAVVISDMRMPGMNGAEFLSQVREKAPESVRMLLTGYSDMKAAMDAVNRGRIFQFLSKPCERDVLVGAISAGVEQYRSQLAEKELVKNAQEVGRSRSEWGAVDFSQWENFESPAGLPGPSEAKAHLQPLVGVEGQCYVALLKLTVLKTVEERYGENAAGDYLGIVAQLLMKTLRPDDQLFHWSRDVLMAVMRRHISPAAADGDGAADRGGAGIHRRDPGEKDDDRVPDHVRSAGGGAVRGIQRFAGGLRRQPERRVTERFCRRQRSDAWIRLLKGVKRELRRWSPATLQRHFCARAAQSCRLFLRAWRRGYLSSIRRRIRSSMRIQWLWR
jgi:FixJ family two-component response regulator/GGDEF domain-containing protein